jgi:hypothetical protein
MYLFEQEIKEYNITKFDIKTAMSTEPNNLNTFSDNNFKLILLLNNLVTCLQKKNRFEDIRTFWGDTEIKFIPKSLLNEPGGDFIISLDGDKTIIGFGNDFVLTSCITQICSRIDLENEKTQENLINIYTKSNEKFILLFITLWAWYAKNKGETYKNYIKQILNKLTNKFDETSLGKIGDYLLIKDTDNYLENYYLDDYDITAKIEEDIGTSIKYQVYKFIKNIGRWSYICDIYDNNNTIYCDGKKYKIKSNERLNQMVNKGGGKENFLSIPNDFILFTDDDNIKLSFFTTHTIDDESLFRVYYLNYDIYCEYNQDHRMYSSNEYPYYISLTNNTFYDPNDFNIIHLKSGIKYKLVEDKNINKILKIFLKFSKNIKLVEDICSNNLSLMIIITNNISYKFNKYWNEKAPNEITFRKSNIHFIPINTNFFSFKFSSINDFHALFISLLLTENTHALSLLENRIKSDVFNIHLHPNKEEYIYYSQINNFAKNGLDIPLAYKFNSTQTILEVKENYKIKIKLNINVYQALENIKKISNYININKKVINSNDSISLNKFLENFRSLCSKLDYTSYKYNKINTDRKYVNEIFEEIIINETFHNIHTLYIIFHLRYHFIYMLRTLTNT